MFFLPFRFTSSRKTGLQTKTFKEMENSQCFSYVTVGVRHYKEGVDKQISAKTKAGQ